MEGSHNEDGIIMSQKKAWVSDKDESWLKIEKEVNGHAYGAGVGTRDGVTEV